MEKIMSVKEKLGYGGVGDKYFRWGYNSLQHRVR